MRVRVPGLGAYMVTLFGVIDSITCLTACVTCTGLVRLEADFLLDLVLLVHNEEMLSPTTTTVWKTKMNLLVDKREIGLAGLAGDLFNAW